MSNNPPFVSLELNQKQAEFLLLNCETNMRNALLILNARPSRKAAEELIGLLEQFKEIVALLNKQGVRS